jgi:hypothetical protein
MIKLRHVIRKAKLELEYQFMKASGKTNLEYPYSEVYADFKLRYRGHSSRFWDNITKDMEKEIIVHGLDDFRNCHFIQYFNTTNEDNVDAFTDIMKYTRWDLNKKVTICEIGSGYGSLAYMFLKLMPNVHYILIDIPQTLIVAYRFLNRLGIADRCKFLVPDEIRNVKPDLWINIDSFQELTYHIIDDYFSYIKNNPAYLYMKELKTNHNSVDGVHLNVDDYPFKRNMRIIDRKVLPLRRIRFDNYGGIWEPYVVMFIKINKI